MPALTRASVVCRGSNHLEAGAGDQTVMMNIAQGNYHAVSGTAQRVWELLAVPISIGSIVDLLVVEYDVAPDVCEKDVVSFVSTLMDHGLVAERTDCKGP